jgi:peptide/nickel transport system permease protein
MRIIDAIWSFPTMILALAVGTAFGAGLTSSFIAVGVVFAPTVTRLVRAQTLSIRELDYVLAARAMGAKPSRIMWQHVWPNVASPVIVQASILVAAAIILEAGLSFLGLGVQPPTPAWGSMLRAGYPFLLTSLWPSVFPGLAIFITVLAFNLLGDGLQQALDPQLRRAKKI